MAGLEEVRPRRKELPPSESTALLLRRATSTAYLGVTSAGERVNSSTKSQLLFHFFLWLIVAWIGAFLFNWLEAEHERQYALQMASEEIHAGRRSQSSQSSPMSHDGMNVSNVTEQIAALNAIIDELQSHCIQGPPSIDEPFWTYPGSLFYSFQLMTTIGCARLTLVAQSHHPEQRKFTHRDDTSRMDALRRSYHCILNV